VQVCEDAGPERSNEPGPHEQLVAEDIRLGRGVAQGLTEELTEFHLKSPNQPAYSTGCAMDLSAVIKGIFNCVARTAKQASKAVKFLRAAFVVALIN
jgi:hypothetical protein